MTGRTGDGAASERAARRLLAAIEARDLAAVEATLSPTASWQNVPHRPAVGRPAVLDMLGPILRMSDRVEWEVLTAAVAVPSVILERLDHFWIDGNRYTVPCNGVFVVDGASGRVVEVRDYVDLGRWRETIGPVYAAWAERSPEVVVERHLAAVRSGDPVAMAADYDRDAVLIRGAESHRGLTAIRHYFDSVPARLGRSELTLSKPRSEADGRVAVEWAIADSGRVAASGVDRYRIENGWIVEQQVELAGPDFG